MKKFDAQLKQLADLAQRAPAPAPAAMPLGFDTRVVARALQPQANRPWLAWEQLAPRSLGLAAVVCAAAVLAGSWPQESDSVNEIQMANRIVENLLRP